MRPFKKTDAGWHERQESYFLDRLWIPLAAGGVLVASYGAVRGSWTVLLVAFSIAFASFSIGGLAGFLFGIPRALTSENEIAHTQLVRYLPNTNLEQISDWLTKILVGIGLVQIGQARGTLKDLASYLSDPMGGGTVASIVSICIIFWYLIAGFFLGFLVTRLRLQREFEEALDRVEGEQDLPV